MAISVFCLPVWMGLLQRLEWCLDDGVVDEVVDLR